MSARTGTKILFARSTDCGKTFGLPIRLASDITTNQGSVIAVDPSSANQTAARVYVAWRRFADTTHSGGIVIAKSIDGGRLSAPYGRLYFSRSLLDHSHRHRLPD